MAPELQLKLPVQVVMAMRITWAFCSRGVNPQSQEFPHAVLVCCPT